MREVTEEYIEEYLENTKFMLLKLIEDKNKDKNEGNVQEVTKKNLIKVYFNCFSHLTQKCVVFRNKDFGPFAYLDNKKNRSSVKKDLSYMSLHNLVGFF